MSSNLPVTAKEKSQNLMMVLQARKDIFKILLPKYMTAEKLFRVAQLAMSKNPKLLACTPASFLVAMMDSAKSGLEPDGKNAALVPYGTECQFLPMWQGMVKQAIRAGAAKKIAARLVHANDKFRIWYDPEPHVEHEPAYDDEGDIIGAYAYAILPDDGLMVEHMNRRQLDHVRGKSQSNSGPWATDPEEMYRKTPTKRLFKYLAIPDELEYAVQVDNMAEIGRPRDDIPLLEKAPEELAVPQTEKIKEKLAAKRGRPPKSEPEPSKEPEPPQGAEATTPFPKEGGITEKQLMELEKVPDDLLLKGFETAEVEQMPLDELTEKEAARLIAYIGLL